MAFNDTPIPVVVPGCNPKTLVNEIPCLQCLTKTQLMLVLVWLFAQDQGYTLPDETSVLMEDAKCWMCLDDTQLLIAAVTVVANTIAPADKTVQDTINEMKCIQCANPQQIKAMLGYLLCQFMAAVQT